MGLAAPAVARPRLLGAPGRVLPLGRLRSGPTGDHVAWLPAGTTLPALLALPGVLTASGQSP
ncbi:hypothetical protein GCM10010129_04570 [Streptomyces fumigatiscleroticus]|nr:hypothetical protein GCM10010129_04570 [Streptomyces fumigatiscleroticus]